MLDEEEMESLLVVGPEALLRLELLVESETLLEDEVDNRLLDGMSD